MIIPIIVSYAEIHYHLKYLFPLYYIKQPEIIADCPRRSISNTLPILIIVKDSHIYPILLNTVYIKISSKEKNTVSEIKIDKSLNTLYFSRILDVDLSQFTPEQFLSVDVVMEIQINGKTHEILNDNYILSPKSFSLYYSDSPLPYPSGWYAGDPHYHSFFTTDQVEFGADLKSTKRMAKAMGLSWFFATDHSYDLDDKIDDYLTNDPDLPKWKILWEEAQKLTNTDFKIIPGEEISIGNNRGKNVHLLAINHRQYVTGSGDSAEIWFRNKPEHSIQEVYKWKNNENLFIAAHPAEIPPLSQRLTLRRGNWRDIDFQIADINYLQLINSADPSNLNKAISYWKKKLLKGDRFLIIGGNDAHGNFNSMRQIKRPFLKLFRSQSQTFGNYHTVFHYDQNDPVAGLKKGEIIVSNGIFLEIKIKGKDRDYPINSTCYESHVTIISKPVIPLEFGTLAFLDLLIGDLDKKRERLIKINTSEIVVDLPAKGYLRFELVSTNGGRLFTNPVWIG